MCKVSHLRVGEFGDGKILLSTFVWRDPVCGVIEVPKGFIFDGATIPRLAWTLIGVTPYDNDIIHAAVVHDWLYATRSLSRKLSDDVFKRIMLTERRLNRFSIRLIFRSVRIGGGRAYNKTRILENFYRPDLLDNCNHE